MYGFGLEMEEQKKIQLISNQLFSTSGRFTQVILIKS